MAPDAEPSKELLGRVEFQARPVTSVPVVRIDEGSPAQPLAPLVVLHDQTSNANLNATSQNFEAAYDSYDNQAADDFVVTAGGGWNVTTVFAPGGYSATHGTPTSMRVAFYADAGGSPGAILCDAPAATFVEAPVGSFTITLPGAGCALSPGTKWVSVVANLNFVGGPGGQWFWTTRTVLTGNRSKWQNPGGGFQTGCSSWNDRTTCLAGQTDPDMAFRLEGAIASCTVDADCADGNLCNGVETCSGGNCQPGTPVNCSDGLVCTADLCDLPTGTCSNPPNPCNDGDSCTVDSCTEAQGCLHSTPATVRVCNTGSIAIPAGGAATPYPAPIVVSGLPASTSVCSVELLGLAHTWPDDIDVLLAGPLGGISNAVIMSDVGGSFPVTNVDLVLKDAAATDLPDAGPLGSGTFRPTNVGGGDVFPAPAPASGGSSALSVFDGTNPNGTWNLFVRDQFTPDSGALSGGWCVNFTLSSCSVDADCSDGNLCNGAETCVDGSCQSGTPVVCDDSLFCTVDTCNPADGACVYSQSACDDANLCTADSCDEANGCLNENRCAQFCSSGPISILDGATPPTAGSPYPSIITVSGVGTPAVLASVEFLISHTFPDDIELLLVGPAGPAQNAILMSDAGGGAPGVTNAFVTFSDLAAAGIPDGGPLVDGVYRLTNIGTGDTYPAPAPVPSAATTLSTFDGDPNGSWSLYVADDGAEDFGSIPAWCVNLLPPGCTANAECDDSNPCTDDICNGGACSNSNNAAPCDDGNPCTTGDACGGGLCTPGAPITPPAELAGMAAPDKVTLTWTVDAQSESYDVVRGATSGLPIGPGGGDELCFPNLAAATVTDVDVPAPGTGYGYLARGKNACGVGTYGTQSDSAPRITTTCP